MCDFLVKVVTRLLIILQKFITVAFNGVKITDGKFNHINDPNG